MVRRGVYKGNFIQQADQVVKDNRPTRNLVEAINQLTDRVFTDVYLTVGVPANGLGEIGDYAINTSTWIPYLKTAATTWTAQTAIDNNTNAFLLISNKR
jgi:hypothetical protein